MVMKYAAIVAIVAISLISAFSNKAMAHLQGYVNIGGTLTHVASVSCEQVLRKVRNLIQHPAVFTCEITTKEFFVICNNPANHNVSPGAAATQEVVLDADAMVEQDNSDIDKEKGRGIAIAHIDTGELEQPQYCVNHNWIPLYAVVTNMDAVIQVWECVGDDPDPCDTTIDPSALNLTYTTKQKCTFPSGVPLVPNPVGTEYDCTITDEEHVD
jgi:hypothetical protein